eukprot:14479402-Ditylum_brightwellii.AAC.1
MVKTPYSTCEQRKMKKGDDDLDETVESQEAIAKSDKESVVSKGTSNKEDVKVPGMDQEEFTVEKRTL